jgi:hypothetical protein
MGKFIFKCCLLFLLLVLISPVSVAQTMESVTFSSVASTNNNFQPVIGSPYGVSFFGANGSLEISASYGESSYDESTLSSESIRHQSSIRVFPNPANYFVNVDLTQLPQDEYHLDLSDATGKLVINKKMSAVITQLDLLEISEGTYMLNVTCKRTKNVYSFKIVKFK